MWFFGTEIGSTERCTARERARARCGVIAPRVAGGLAPTATTVSRTRARASDQRTILVGSSALSAYRRAPMYGCGAPRPALPLSRRPANTDVVSRSPRLRPGHHGTRVRLTESNRRRHQRPLRRDARPARAVHARLLLLH